MTPEVAPITAAMPSDRQMVALLAPLTGANASLGTGLANAAKLALENADGVALQVYDTTATPQGAAVAAASATAAGASLILGPLTSGETGAAAEIARQARVPMLAFTSDSSHATAGVWVLGITPAQQIRRAMSAAVSQGKSRFAAVLPDTDFGHAVGLALEREVASANLPPPDIRFHTSAIAELNSVMRDISGYSSRRGPIDAKLREARTKRDADSRRMIAELTKSPIPPPPFDVLVLADTGEQLAALTSLLPYYDLDPPSVQVVGPALWAAAQARGGTKLDGAWYAAPDASTRTEFSEQYKTAYGSPAPLLADFAYDGASIARVLAAKGRITAMALVRPEGFLGVGGIIAFQPEGAVRRGLAIFQIGMDGPKRVDPAPDNSAAPGF